MSSPRPNTASLFFLLILFSIASYKLSYCINFCPEIEKQSLLSLKQSLRDPSNKLSSWNINGEVDCCKWKGVVCNNYSGHVDQLYLRNYNLSGKLNPSLLNLKRLRLLDLSQNDFALTIPSFIGSFPSLEYLDLSDAGFHGTIPQTIGNLSNLRTLNLESSIYQSVNLDSILESTIHLSLNVDSLEWLSGLSQLEYLNMNFVNLSKASTNWIQVINTLSSLVDLRFGYCSLNFIAPINDVVNVSSLSILYLSANEFQSLVIPKWIFQFSELTYLSLGGCHFEGPIPSVSNTTKLQYIDLSHNYFNFTIPNWLYFCKDLEFVSLRLNSLHGAISNAIANLTSLNTLDLCYNSFSGKIPREIANLCKMKILDLSFNKFEGEILDSFGNMSACFLGTLEFLNLGRNQLSGPVPDQFGEFKNIQRLYLDINRLTGNLPESLGKLFNLEILSIMFNMLEGEVTESHLVNLTRLRFLSLSGNYHLTLKVNPNWIPPFKLMGLGLGSMNLSEGTQIQSWLPSWLDTKEDPYYLDLSSTGISGHVPNWFWNISLLNLSHNHLHGKIPNVIGREDDVVQSIYLSSNQFSGPLPRVANSVTELDLSDNLFSGGMSHFLCDTTNQTYRLMILHLEGNKLIGKLPDCFMKWPNLMVLNLGYNNMYGSIPNSIGFLANLWSLNLNSNRFSGRLPFSMHTCSSLFKIDLSHNDFDGDLPTWIGTSLTDLMILSLHSNKFSGEISPNICHLTSLQILDLSNNEFFGMIPRCFNNFTAMATKRTIVGFYYSEIYLSFIEGASVSTKGTESHYDTILGLVININLSKNNFSGNIPEELTSLVELQSLNLSENHLKGSIPDRIGEMKQLESLDFSRNSLSGEIPDSFSTMSALSCLNLSYNNLSGRIPQSTQILGFNASSFIGNNLCGPPLTSNCSNDDEVHGAQLNKEDNEGNKSEIHWFYIFLSLGYAVGFSAVCTTLIIKKPWRDAYFGLLEDLWNKVYVYSYIKWRRFVER